MTYTLPEEYYFSKDHEWALLDENIATIGITEYARESLGEIVYIELPEEGQKLTQFQTFGVLESVKAVSDLYSPVAGTVIEINQALIDNPNALNDDPMSEGWLIKIEMENENDLANLLRAKDYRLLLGQSK